MATTILRGPDARFQSRDFATATGNLKRGSNKCDSSGSGFIDNGDTSEKRLQRQIVADFLVTHHTPIRIISLPGVSWNVELAIADQRTDCTFSGCERDSSTFIRSQAFIPEYKLKGRLYSQRKLYEITLKDSTTRPVYVSKCWKTRFYHSDIQSIIDNSGNRAAFILGRKMRCPLSERFNAFWVDSFSPVGSSSFLSIARSVFLKSSTDSYSLFALAFVVGRDIPEISTAISLCPGEDSIQKRAEFIQLIGENCGRSVTICKVHRHKSWNTDGHVNIGTVMGRID